MLHRKKNILMGLVIKQFGFSQFQRTHLRMPVIKKMVFRQYLSSSYKLEDVWHQRLQDPFVKETKAVEFYYDIIRKYRKEGKIAAIDADLFINSIDSQSVSSLSEEMEEVLHLLRRSPETINTLESTTHAIIRNWLYTENYPRIMKLVSDPANYGIFLEPYLANLSMDKFLAEKNYTYAARIAASLMLQEDYGPPLTKALVLLSCFQYIFNITENQDWIDYTHVPEPEEEVKIVVKYIRNPYFDDHFDLKYPFHIVGKTLAWLSPVIEEPFKINAEVLGWSSFNKWKKLEESLSSVLTTNKLLDKQVLSIVIKQVEEKCEDKDSGAKLLSLITGVKNRKDCLQDLNIICKIEQHVKDQVEKFEETDIKNQTEVYNYYSIKRKESIEKQLELYERTRLIKELESKKKYLKEKEDVIFFFDNKDKIEVELLKKKQLYPEEESEKAKAKAEDEEYISPGVRHKRS